MRGGVTGSDPATQAMLTFMSTHVALGRMERGGAEVIDALGGFISRYAVVP